MNSTPVSADPLQGATTRSVRRRRGGIETQAQDLVAAEVPVALAYNGESFAVMMATPTDLHDFALGFSLSEGLIEAPHELRVDAIDRLLEGVSIAMTVPAARAQALDGRRRNLEGRSGCGLCGSESIEAVLRPPSRVGAGCQTSDNALASALSELAQRQPLNARTGATHAAAFASSAGELLFVREDIGRHNALDKLIGAMAGDGIDPAQGFALVTSRASYEMVLKTARAGIPTLVAISAPTALAIALADSANLTLVAFARDDGCVVYSHPHRLASDVGEAAA